MILRDADLTAIKKCKFGRRAQAAAEAAKIEQRLFLLVPGLHSTQASGHRGLELHTITIVGNLSWREGLVN